MLQFMFLQFYLVYGVSCMMQSVYQDFNIKIISLTNTEWYCGDQNSKPINVFHCNKGYDLVRLEQQSHTCHQIQKEFNTLMPHSKIQVYIDVYGYGSLDDNYYECIKINVADQQEISQCLYPISNKILGLSVQCNYQNRFNYQLRKTQVISINHSNDQLRIVISSNTNQNFDDEQYLFRNVQLFSDRCYKTCNKCFGEGKNQCKSCYSDIQIINSTCDNCMQKLDLGFLHIPIGCVNKCPDGFDFDEDQVCIDNRYNQVICQKDCYICTNNQSCLVCNSLKFQYLGQCFDICPDFTKAYGGNCLNNIDELQNQNLRFIQLVQEFHDLSTTKDRIDQLFILKEKDGKDFQKGDNIYFSYLQNKRIFGGPFVWINARFEFTLRWVEDIQFLRIRFEIILGDTQFGRTQFIYLIHQQQQNIISLNNSYIGIHDIIEDHNWPNDYKYNLYLVDKTIDCKNIANKEVKIQFKCYNQDQLGFCGMQNMIIIGIFDCDPEYKFDQFNYDTN